MSLNHVIDNNESEQLKINIECKSLTAREDLNVICLNDDEVNLKMPNKGTNGDVLQSTGAGSVFWGAPTGSSGVAYQGINPVPVGTHYKISNTTGSEVTNSQLVETSGEINFNLMDITNARYYNNTVISSGNVESTGTADLDLTSASGTIRLHSEISAEDNKIINCLDPTLPTDVATKNYVDNNAVGIIYNSVQPTAVGELLKFSSTDGSTVNKSVMVEDAVNLNLGSLNITNVGNVDGVDILAFKTDYDSKVNQDVKNTANPTFASITTPIITNFGSDILVNNLVFAPNDIYGGEGIGDDLNLYSTNDATKGTIRLHDETSVEDNKIINCLDPTIATDVATKNYVDNQISGISTQVYDIVVPLTSETGNVDATGIKYTLYTPRTFTLTTVKASLTTAQTSGNAITISIQRAGVEVLNPASGLTFVNGNTLSNQPGFVSNPTILTANDKLEFNITQVGDGTGVGLKITLLGTV
jgi:hypothetical protein